MIDTTLSKQLQQIRAISKKKSKAKSRLNAFKYEILELSILHEASAQEIVLWLRTRKRIKVNKTTVWRFVKKHTSEFMERSCHE